MQKVSPTPKVKKEAAVTQIGGKTQKLSNDKNQAKRERLKKKHS